MTRIASPHSVTLAPGYTQHRRAVAATDTLPVAEKSMGISVADHETAHVQVVPSGGANPSVAVLWWSEAATKFIQEHVPITKAGVGADTPYEFSVEAKGRIMLVVVTAIAAGAVDVYVGAFSAFPRA